MKLFELFNAPAKWRFTDNGETDAVAEFEVNAVPYVLTLQNVGQYGNWQVEFENQSVSPNMRFGITGQGNASTVFATVCDILKRFIRARDVYTMGFVAEEENRKKLYKHIVKTVFPGWKISQYDNVIEVEQKSKYNEGRVSDRLVLDKEWERQNSSGPTPSLPTEQMNYNIVVNDKVWKDFPTEQKAMLSATSLHNKNPKLRISVVPK